MKRWISQKFICALILSVGAFLPGPFARVTTAKQLKLVPLRLPGGGEPRVVAMTEGPATADSPMFLGGTLTLDGTRRPAVWRTTDAATFELVPVQSNPGYGEICEVFAIAAIGERVAATCQAFGGAHGNARTSAFVRTGAGEPIRELTTSFELYNGPRQIAVKSIAPKANGFVIFGSRVNRNGALGAASWTTEIADWSTTAEPEFVLHDNDGALSSTGQEQVQGLSISSDGAGGMIAGGERLWWRQNRQDPTENDTDTDVALWTSANGVEWNRSTRISPSGPGAQRLHALSVHDGTLVAAGSQTIGNSVTIVVWMPDGRVARRIVRELGTSSDVLSAATSIAARGRLVLVGTRMSERARVAISRDGGQTFRALRLPADSPVGARTKAVVGFVEPGRALVAVSSESGGATFTISLG